MPHPTRHIFLLFTPIFLGSMLLAAGPETLVDNDQVRVVKVTDEPHTRGAAHQHRFNRVMIYLQGGRQDITTGGKHAIRELKPGEVAWNPAGPTHTSEILSDAPVTMIEIEIKKPGDPGKTADNPLHPLRVAPQQAKLEFENSQVRVFRVKAGPRGTVPMHEHILNKVSVNLTPVDERITTAAGRADVIREPSPTAVWGGPVEHREENLADTPMETIVVELKNQP